MEKIQIRICPDGRIKAETLGIKGEKCKDVIGLLEGLLDADVVETHLKPEFYEMAGLKLHETLRREE
ncbi:DUF2997 domain-containing protein [Paenibacillus sp. TH7-28]